MVAQHSDKRAPKQAKHAPAQPQKSAMVEPPAHNSLWQSLALRPLTIQPKLTINQPGDAYEQEADRVAEQVMRMPDEASGNPAPTAVRSSHLQRKEQADGNPDAATAPASWHEVLSASGQPLDAGTRAFFEPRFGQDFSQVRVHSGEAAAQSARDLNALAYTTGHNIVFGAGQAALPTVEGRRLLAHELTHVVQQTGVSNAGDFVQRQAAPAPVQAATPAQRQEFAEEAARMLRDQGDFFVLQPNRDLTEILTPLRTTAENGLAVVANDPSATAVADQVRTAYRNAVRTVLVSRTRTRPGGTRTPPSLQELYEAHRDAILSFALPQAQADTGADELSAELSAALPDRPSREQRARHTALTSARQRLRVVTAAIDMPIGDLFSTQGGTMRVPLPANTTARFSSTIPTALHRGLTSLAGQLIPATLSANTTVLMALDLTPYGGSYDSYRFTRLDLGGLGTEVLIERQGAIGVEGLQTAERQRLQDRFDRVGFRRVPGGFRGEEFDQVLIGLAEIPEAQLTTLGNLRFERQSSDPQHADEAGHYDQAAHTIRLFDTAFSAGRTRFGRNGRLLKFAAHAVAHEVGHALDLSAIRTTAAATEAAQSALTGEFGTGTIIFNSAAERARFDELNRSLTAATAAERAARSHSGARWTMGNPNEVTDDLASGARQPAFRQAALQDGGTAGRQMPTTYPNPDSVWQEYFAESFALYQTSPELLRRMRPNVFRFMEQTFPR